MNSKNSRSAELPSYVTSATPNPMEKRAPWYKNTAPTYAGIFLWFVFWQGMTLTQGNSQGGILSQGILVALLGVALAALVCHFLFYLVPGMFGMKTGLPLYIIGTSTFGARGGFIMPGFLMGVLQFGWLGVNVYASSLALSAVIPLPAEVIMVVFGLLGAFVGLKGIQYVAKVSTYLPLIPLLTLVWLVSRTMGGLATFDPAQMIQNHQALVPAAPSPLGVLMVFAAILTSAAGFFATAGAAGVDFGLNSRDKKDVSMGGLVGIALAIFVTGGLATLVVAGVYGSESLAAGAYAAAKQQNGFILDAFNMIPVVLGPETAKWVMFLLAVTAFPAACISSFIAANSFKTTLPKVNPYISVGLGAGVSILLAITGLVSKLVSVFTVIGASFAPICGAMFVEYLLSRGKWTGPRAGFNPAGWIAWAVGFTVGVLPNLGVNIPASPVMAFLVGAGAYFIAVKLGLQTAVVPLSGKQSTRK